MLFFKYGKVVFHYLGLKRDNLCILTGLVTQIRESCFSFSWLKKGQFVHTHWTSYTNTGKLFYILLA